MTLALPSPLKIPASGVEIDMGRSQLCSSNNKDNANSHDAVSAEWVKCQIDWLGNRAHGPLLKDIGVDFSLI